MTTHNYSATAHREGPWWVVEVPEVGVTQGRNTTEAEHMAEGLVRATYDLPHDAAVTVEVEFALTGELADTVAAARTQTRHAVEAQRVAAEQSRQAARRLLREGMTKQDAARILKVSRQRVSQLVK